MKEIATSGAEKTESPRISPKANQNKTSVPLSANEPSKLTKDKIRSVAHTSDQ